MIRRIFSISIPIVLAVTLVLSIGGPAVSADAVKFGIVCEVSGGGATVAKNWERGVHMAVDEINQAGGILGKKIETFTLDTQSKAPVSVAAMKKAIERKPFVIMGTIYSSSTIVNMSILEKAGIPQFVGSEAPKITQQGNKNIFRSSYAADLSMKKVVKWLTDVHGVKKLAIVYVNDAFGKGGRDALVNLLTAKGVELVSDIATEPGQMDFTGELARVKKSPADTLFIYLHEEESGRILPAIREMGVDKKIKIVGHTTLLAADTVRLAGKAADGVQGHVGLSPVAPPLKAIANKYSAKYNEKPDHNFFKAYISTYVVKAMVEEIGAFDQLKLRDKLHNHTLYVKDHPNILMDIYYDENGDIDRESFLVEIQDGKHVITKSIPPFDSNRFKGN
ncbi:MAG: ABC transporter substrate-binding protein [Desulfobacterales bacterium]|jgi:branched-chain amino acid transport system substrate-binding protein